MPGEPEKLTVYQLVAHVVDLEGNLLESMEKRLAANDHKGGWEDSTEDWLFSRMIQEVGELNKALGLRNGIVEKAADVANFAMMLADNSGGLEEAMKKKPVRSVVGVWAGGL